MPHITLEYSANIGGQLDAPTLLRKLHETVINSGIEALKIKSRAIKLDDYIIGDGQTHTSMVHINCLLLAGRPDTFGAELSKALFNTTQTHIAAQTIEQCAASVEVRDMDAKTYSK